MEVQDERKRLWMDVNSGNEVKQSTSGSWQPQGQQHSHGTFPVEDTRSKHLKGSCAGSRVVQSG